MIDPRGLTPLPYYAWDERPASVPLSTEEAETAIYLAKGDLFQAARLLKVGFPLLSRFVKRSYPLQRLKQRCEDDKARAGGPDQSAVTRAEDGAGAGGPPAAGAVSLRR